MPKGISIKEALEAGATLPRGVKEAVFSDEVDRLALKVLGVLAEATNGPTRRRALEKARRMLSRR